MAPLTSKKSFYIFIFLLAPLSSISSSPSSSSTKNKNHNFISPVRNLEASLAASAAHTTVVAVQSFRNRHDDVDGVDCDDDDRKGEDCVVLLSRTPPIVGRELMSNLTRSSAITTVGGLKRQMKKPLSSQEDDDGDDYLIPILSRGSVKMRTLTASNEIINGDNDNEPRRPPPTHHEGKESRNLHILQPSSGLCLAVTGFALDGAHLVRYVAESVSNHEYIYGCGGSSSSSSVPDVHKIVREDLAPKMRDAAFVGGGRPFGVELLVVGSDHRGGGDTQRSMTNSMVLYTLDPSGNWKHWGGGGTCIGKGAESVRKQLYQTLYCKPDNEVIRGNDSIKKRCQHPKTWERALEVAMEATFKAMDLDEHAGDDEKFSSNKKATADYDAIVLFGSDSGASGGNASRCAIIDRQFIAEMYQKCADNAIQNGLREGKD